MAKFRKKSLNFGSGQQNCSSFLHATKQGHYIYTLFRSLFDPIGLKTTLPDLSTFLS